MVQRKIDNPPFLNMRFRTTISFLALFFVTHVVGQTRALTGKIIDDSFQPFMQVKIFNADTVQIGKSDMTGNFNITIPLNIKTLIIASIGMEWKRIDLTDTCNNIEIILLPSWTYDFRTLKKVDRLRKKEFDKLPRLHKSAFEKGIFISDKPCYVDNFIPIRRK
ncbi:MAG: hypothetical protein QM726_15815 [Chitinophagaceae bacterium]